MSKAEKDEVIRNILVYGDSLSWGIVPLKRERMAFPNRWPGVLEIGLNVHATDDGKRYRVIEDCLNGRRTVWDDPYKPGRNGLDSLGQKIEIHSPLHLVILMLGTNDFQSLHAHNAWHSAQGIVTLIRAIRHAPVEPEMFIPPILVVAPPPMGIPKGPIAPKFLGGKEKSIGLADAYREVTEIEKCHFFDAGTVTGSSELDGIHLDPPQHRALALALKEVVRAILG
ncbi:MAG: SGNH/GDSL hydrolase family protein [Gammaproteobacteria bacterium]|nr:SGNH/GDSL hydrolase family protein [Gammaproteobacteria bacterium]